MALDAAKHGAKKARIPVAREGTLDEVAQAARWLLSPASAHAVGTVLTLDGGYTPWGFQRIDPDDGVEPHPAPVGSSSLR